MPSEKVILKNLDLLPTNMSFRDFDIFLSRMKKSRTRLNKALKSVDGEYDVVLLDCPPNISLLSENVFKVADRIVVPVIPTTLSQRTLEQLYAFFKKQGYKPSKIFPFFSMVQQSKSLHVETMEEIRAGHAQVMNTWIPFSTHIERMAFTGLRPFPMPAKKGQCPPTHNCGRKFKAKGNSI